MLFKVLFITIFIPSIINILFVLSLHEKDKANIVHSPKFMYLYLPCGGGLFLGLGASFNLKSYIDGGYVNKDAFAFSLLLFIGSALCLLAVIIYKISIIKYDNEKLLYHGKCYYYNQICSLGNDKNNYTFVLENGKKIKFSILAVGSNELCKTYLNYKKKQKTNTRDGLC